MTSSSIMSLIMVLVNAYDLCLQFMEAPGKTFAEARLLMQLMLWSTKSRSLRVQKHCW